MLGWLFPVAPLPSRQAEAGVGVAALCCWNLIQPAAAPRLISPRAMHPPSPEPVSSRISTRGAPVCPRHVAIGLCGGDQYAVHHQWGQQLRHNERALWLGPEMVWIRGWRYGGRAAMVPMLASCGVVRLEAAWSMHSRAFRPVVISSILLARFSNPVIYRATAWFGNPYMLDQSGMYLQTAAVNGFRFIPSSGTITNGVFKLYGIAK